MYRLENDTTIWGVSGTLTPVSRHILAQFIESQKEDIYTYRQLRLMVCKSDGETVGMVDLFELDTHNRRAGVGIIIAPEFQQMGYGHATLDALDNYARSYLNIHQLWCNIGEDNHPSQALFRKMGYVHVGTKQEWNIAPNGSFKAELTFQKLL